MMSGIARAAAPALGPLVLGLGAAMPLAAQEGMPPNYTVDVVREHAAGMIFVNGIPVHPFAYDPS
ncbi:MAG: hypothetical protein FJX36_11040 [Alphaproteobacteria bacterium]|nr:hypothetical protein [Alphaproteobacteria bacterium]